MNEQKTPGSSHQARRKRVKKQFELLHGQPTYWNHGMLYFFRSGLPIPEAPEIRKPGSGYAPAEHAHKTLASRRPIHISQFDRERGSQPRCRYDK